ncbi:MAG: HU family DNA-binding protein [Proteobacteria bacterium]|nr:HU family DNA-binding protein [Pseudomonadota bacterium]
MTKADLVSQIAKQSELTKAKAEKIVNAIIDNIKDALVKGNDVALVGFGSFSTTKRSARTGRNPQTGKKMSIPAKTVPKFRAGKGLREAVNTKGKKKKK